jgi:hypothetical protein
LFSSSVNIELVPFDYVLVVQFSLIPYKIIADGQVIFVKNKLWILMFRKDTNIQLIKDQYQTHHTHIQTEVSYFSDVEKAFLGIRNRCKYRP